MEALLVKSVERNLSQFLLNNAIFLCLRLCAQFPSEVNLQLLARCYFAYHIPKVSCFQMDLFGEAEAALAPHNQADSKVPNGASVHYTLGLIYRYTDRKENAIKHLKKALSIDPLFWKAYEELCTLDQCAAEEAASVFLQIINPFCCYQRLLYFRSPEIRKTI